MQTPTLYQSASSPNSRRVRIFLAEKGIDIPLVAVDLGKGEQHTEAYRAINSRRVVPTLVLEDGTSIGEVPAIWRYLEETHPAVPLLGTTPKEQALIAMWERRVEQEGFASVMEAVRNHVPGLKERAIAGAHDYAQIPAMVDRGKLRLLNFYADLDARLQESAFVAGHAFSVADITALVTIDFAAKALGLPFSDTQTAIKRWYAEVSLRPGTGA
jgi:glutathione S-transferase